MSPTAYLESKPFKTLSLKLYKYVQFIPHREHFPFPLQRFTGDSYETHKFGKYSYNEASDSSFWRQVAFVRGLEL